jgi:hypothetical protein
MSNPFPSLRMGRGAGGKDCSSCPRQLHQFLYNGQDGLSVDQVREDGVR